MRTKPFSGSSLHSKWVRGLAWLSQRMYLAPGPKTSMDARKSGQKPNSRSRVSSTGMDQRIESQKGLEVHRIMGSYKEKMRKEDRNGSIAQLDIRIAAPRFRV